MNRRKTLGVGSVSLILIFCVLCLVIFALLTLSTARSENKLAHRLAGSVSAYYAADLEAAMAYAELKDAVSGGSRPDSVRGFEVSYTEAGGDLSFYYLVYVDENRSIAVRAEYDGGDFAILQWFVTDNGAWEPDDRLPVYTE